MNKKFKERAKEELIISKYKTKNQSNESILQSEDTTLTDVVQKETRLPCQISGCDRSFLNVKSYRNHLTRHDKEGRMFMCEICLCHELFSPSDLFIHKKIEHSVLKTKHGNPIGFKNKKFNKEFIKVKNEKFQKELLKEKKN